MSVLIFTKFVMYVFRSNIPRGTENGKIRNQHISLPSYSTSGREVEVKEWDENVMVAHSSKPDLCGCKSLHTYILPVWIFPCLFSLLIVFIRTVSKLYQCQCNRRIRSSWRIMHKVAKSCHLDINRQKLVTDCNKDYNYISLICTHHITLIHLPSSPIFLRLVS